MGLGPYPTIGLALARTKAAEARRTLTDGLDPLAVRQKAAEAAKFAAVSAISFEAATDKFIAAKSKEWTNEKHKAQWRASLAAHAFPEIGARPVAEIDKAAVIRVLEPIWLEKLETARRVRQRIERILEWAVSMGYRSEGANPARWRGHLENVFARPSRMQTVKHHAAIPFDDLPAFWQALGAQTAVGGHCLRWTILTATRTGEAIGAKWAEIDLAAKTWTIPKERMKAKREHIVPLSSSAFKVLAELAPLRRSDGFVFPGMKAGKPLSNMGMLTTLARMGRSDLTVHGFRSTFRDWVAERTNFPGEVAEAALAHTIENATEAAYRRGDLLEKRRKLMEAWGGFVTTPPADGQKVALMRKLAS
jgi:integrase